MIDVFVILDSLGFMIKPHFLSPSERDALESCVCRQREDHGIARRANAILLLDDGESCTQIAKFLYLDDDTIRGCIKPIDAMAGRFLRLMAGLVASRA